MRARKRHNGRKTTTATATSTQQANQQTKKKTAENSEGDLEELFSISLSLVALLTPFDLGGSVTEWLERRIRNP